MVRVEKCVTIDLLFYLFDRWVMQIKESILALRSQFNLFDFGFWFHVLQFPNIIVVLNVEPLSMLVHRSMARRIAISGVMPA